MSLDENKSFYFVADGVVQVFTRAEHRPVVNSTGIWDEEDLNGYQLLNEVGAGGTLSSLFKILNLLQSTFRSAGPATKALQKDNTVHRVLLTTPQVQTPCMPISDRIEPFQMSRYLTLTVVGLLLYHDLLVPASGGNPSPHPAPSPTLPIYHPQLCLMNHNPEIPCWQPAFGLQPDSPHFIVALWPGLRRIRCLGSYPQKHSIV